MVWTKWRTSGKVWVRVHSDNTCWCSDCFILGQSRKRTRSSPTNVRYDAIPWPFGLHRRRIERIRQALGLKVDLVGCFTEAQCLRAIPWRSSWVALRGCANRCWIIDREVKLVLGNAWWVLERRSTATCWSQAEDCIRLRFAPRLWPPTRTWLRQYRALANRRGA